ncbi:MAG: hypothetical protein FJY86_03615 [Candidatus Diapherotrites archaeon]|uniref:Protein export membrane protein SecD/SecF C-terminal domain-containing protein n=1 Tax=Candidatus Iainarchaeum sp. TaxID=3101447 RepID=A0A8T4CBT7_9ARCH|nr:hypothetical protein [Candidatus Diapherotrites archaeon]
MSAKKWYSSWKVWVWALIMIISLASIIKIDTSNGFEMGHNLKLGSEFSGGTLFQLQLAQPASQQELSEIRLIVEKRLNPTGIKDVSVSNTGNTLIIAQVAETDPVEVSKLQSLLLKQGKFESFLNGNIVFDGSDIVQVVENAQQGYGAHPTGVGDNYAWTLPFLLNDRAAKAFSNASFHQCTQTGFTSGKAEWDCAYTYFFIDRPDSALIIYPNDLMRADDTLLDVGTGSEFPSSITVSNILDNADLTLIKLSGSELSTSDENVIQSLSPAYKSIIVPASLDENVIASISALSTIPVTKVSVSKTSPWIVDVSGLRDIIALSPGITGNDPFVNTKEEVKPLQFLVIQGTAPNATIAKQRLDDLRVLLKSGALPIPIIAINKQTVSPALGEQFLTNVWLMGILALVVVSLIVYVRYRQWKVVGPVLMVGLSEVVMILGFASLVKWNLDLASMAGILAAVGTGVDSEVIMTDEILQGNAEEEHDEKGWAAKAKRAFFIVAASASVGLAAIIPLLVLGSGIGKLSGFALTTIAGILMGVLISRPAFQEIIKVVLVPKKHHEHSNDSAPKTQ